MESGRSSVVAAVTIDGRGAYVIPGLLDMHAHVRANGLPEWVTTDWMMPLILAHGVTGVREMGSDCDNPEAGPVCLDRLKELREEIEAGARLGPRLLSLSSWVVNPPWDYDITAEQAAGVVAMFAEQNVDMIKIYHRLAPDALALIMGEAARRGIDAGGHVPLRMTAADASRAGLRSVEHARDLLFDCFPGTAEFRSAARSLDPPLDVLRGMVDEHDASMCDDVFRTFVANETWYVPTHVTRRMDALAHDSAFRDDPRKRFLPPAMWEGWTADADRMAGLYASAEGRRLIRGFYEMGLDLTGKAHRAGVRILVGTDGGDTYSFPGSAMHDEMAELVKAGLTPAEALRAATLSAAEYLGRADLYGTVAAGRRADLVLLDANPLDDIANTRRIRAVILGGRHLDRDRLDAMLRDVAAAAQRPLRH
jgi:hypothetical protein